MGPTVYKNSMHRISGRFCFQTIHEDTSETGSRAEFFNVCCANLIGIRHLYIPNGMASRITTMQIPLITENTKNYRKSKGKRESNSIPIFYFDYEKASVYAGSIVG